MKKFMLLATICVAGLVSAKNAEEIKPTKEVEKKEILKASESKQSQLEAFKMQCINYGMFIPCTQETIPDQVCYGEGTGVLTYDDAMHCISENGSAAIEFFCG